MQEYPHSIQALIEALRRLPSVGARSAERFTFFLLQAGPHVSETLARALDAVRERVTACPACGFWSEAAACALCEDAQRDRSLLCVVERAEDIVRLERAASYRGLYHALGGRLSPLDGIGPEDLRIAALEARLEKNPPQEVILALSADVEGETTALYLVDLLKGRGIRVSRLATGLPAGAGLEFADSVTLGYALAGRREV